MRCPSLEPTRSGRAGTQPSRLGACMAGALLATTAASAAPVDDAYLAGYAAGVLKREFAADVAGIKVRRGVMTVPVGALPAAERAGVLQALAAIPGVVAVEAVERMPEADAPGSATPGAGRVSSNSASDAPVFATGALPTGHLFKPLLADPRWAHFSAAYRNYIGRELDGTNNASVSFGETLPFYRGNLGLGSAQWEAGLQAGVFSDFNLDARSSDLINSDFIASAYGSLRAGQFSAFGRLYHQSSHLGDEFLLQTRLARVNLSYEGADLRLSYELPYGLRVYGGGGGILSKEPDTLETWSVQYGAEFRSPWRFESTALRPVAGIDIKQHEQNEWRPDVSVRAGLQLDNVMAFGRKLQFLAEYFSGYSPTGQFYRDKVEYVGIGAHYHY
jgi:hypothetical protein